MIGSAPLLYWVFILFDFLATLGLFEQQSSESQPAQHQNSPVQTDAKLNSQRDSLKGKLMGSV
ncbi:hypothetical protein [Klebsiella pneumoniae IS43]|uniref:Uncharacterized protein n=1 Tax=Klebsiella pneumoniae IS43 TaxID=1432552 RepID=W1DHL6_KLEPN|nr:hypothetical protein [Klebsiella pneumoniae IS43]